MRTSYKLAVFRKREKRLYCELWMYGRSPEEAIQNLTRGVLNKHFSLRRYAIVPDEWAPAFRHADIQVIDGPQKMNLNFCQHMLAEFDEIYYEGKKSTGYRRRRPERRRYGVDEN